MSTMCDGMAAPRCSQSYSDVDEQLVEPDLLRDEPLLERVLSQRLDAAPVDVEPVGQRIVADDLHLFEIASISVGLRLAFEEAIDITPLRCEERVEQRFGEPRVRFENLVLDDEGAVHRIDSAAPIELGPELVGIRE